MEPLIRSRSLLWLVSVCGCSHAAATPRDTTDREPICFEPASPPFTSDDLPRWLVLDTAITHPPIAEAHRPAEAFGAELRGSRRGAYRFGFWTRTGAEIFVHVPDFGLIANGTSSSLRGRGMSEVWGQSQAPLGDSLTVTVVDTSGVSGRAVDCESSFRRAA